MQIIQTFKNKLTKLFQRSTLSLVSKSSKYDAWIKTHETPINIKYIHENPFPYTPKISIIMPVWNTGERWLHFAIQSVINQSYDNWELCIADGHSTNPNIKKILQKYSKTDKRIKTIFLKENAGIAGNTNEALKLAEGTFVCFLDHDDELPSICLYEIIKLLNFDKKYDIIYSDNDKIDEYGRRTDPFFKFDFSLPALLSTNYPFHLFVCRKSLIDCVGGLRCGFEGAQDFDLILRVVERTNPQNIAHIDKILYHWRMIHESSAHSSSAKPYAYTAGKLALQEYLVRNNIIGTVDELEPGSYRVKKESPQDKNISIIITNASEKNETFTQKLNSLLQITTYPISKLFVPKKYKDELIYPFVQVFNKNPFVYLKDICETENFDYLIIINDMGNFDESFMANPEWIQSLIEHYSHFNVGIVGTGSLVFSNIICNIERPCGPVFCVKRNLITDFLNQQTNNLDFDELQIQISEFSERAGCSNLYTPFSLGNLPNYNRISQYYSNFKSRKYFTKNMEFYLHSYLIYNP